MTSLIFSLCIFRTLLCPEICSKLKTPGPSTILEGTGFQTHYSSIFCIFVSFFPILSFFVFIGPCPHRERAYRIRSNFWKFYLIKIGFTFGEPVSLLKVFRLYIYQCVCDALFIKGRGKKNQAGSLCRARFFQIFDPFPWPTGLVPGSQILMGLFSDPSPIHIWKANK